MRKMWWGRDVSRRTAVVTVTAIVLVIAGTGTVLADPAGWLHGSDNPWPYDGDRRRDPVLATVGDIWC